MRWGWAGLASRGRATGGISPFATDFHGYQKAIFADTANTWGNCYNAAVVAAVPPGRIRENPGVIRENPWLRGKTIHKHLPSLEYEPSKSQL
jgi:hypothetical protein